MPLGHAEVGDDLAVEPRLLARFADDRLLGGLAGLDAPARHLYTGVVVGMVEDRDPAVAHDVGVGARRRLRRGRGAHRPERTA